MRPIVSCERGNECNIIPTDRGTKLRVVSRSEMDERERFLRNLPSPYVLCTIQYTLLNNSIGRRMDQSMSHDNHLQ
jgi:hypothetical protein